LELDDVDDALEASGALSDDGAEPVAAEPARRGGQAVVEKYGRDYMAALGRRGSRAVVRRYGLRFYSEIAARNKGVKKQRRDGQQTS
jgi:hypothetical protein